MSEYAKAGQARMTSCYVSRPLRGYLLHIALPMLCVMSMLLVALTPDVGNQGGTLDCNANGSDDAGDIYCGTPGGTYDMSGRYRSEDGDYGDPPEGRKRAGM